MITKYAAEFNKEVINNNLHRLIGQIYKLLPYREEGNDWEKPLNTIQNELAGMDSLFIDYRDFHCTLLSLESKLEGLITEDFRDDFDMFRGTIFECIGKVKDLQELVSCLD